VKLLVLSPHRDDAVFSLFLTLSEWRARGHSITVQNFFTVSEYGPRVTSPAGREVVSWTRQREDHRVLRGLQIRWRDAGLLDAPLRLPISFSEICSPHTKNHLLPEHLQNLTQYIRGADLVLAPLALGDHVDHWAVQLAARHSNIAVKLGFYEDLPYATWTAESVVRDRLQEISRQTKRHYRSRRCCPLQPLGRKRREVARYQSQITRMEAEAIARFSSGGRGERIWIPAHSRRWNALTTAGA
jgi:LmbE family N-acetylglucosaminyl deacetylase